jgi:hypothetical protein
LIDVPGANHTILTDINSRGTIVGYFASDVGDSPFSYSDGTFTFIDRPPEADAHMVPISIANNGTIVGAFGGEFDSRGFILRDGEFTIVNYPGAGWTTLTGIASEGTIVGAAAFRLEEDPDGHGPWVGFVYREGRFEAIGQGIFPVGINASRVVAGWIDDGHAVRGFTTIVRH